MERREKERGAHGGEGYSRRKKKARASRPVQEQEEQRRTRPLAHSRHAHTQHTLGPRTVRIQQHAARSSTLPSFLPGEGEREKGRRARKGCPWLPNPARNWTRIGCLAGKGRLLSVLTDPAALVPDRGGTVDQSHALSSRSTAHLVCNPHALLPWAPASLPTLPPTCSLMPSL